MKERGRLYVMWVALALSLTSVVAQQRRTLIDADWEFAQEGQSVVSVNLPHDWSIQGVPSVDEPAGNDGGYYPTGKGEYRKVLHLKTKGDDRRYSLYFEGVYMNAEVIVNGTSTGTQHYGYSSFLRDVTELLREGDNEVVVRVDNSQQKNSVGIRVRASIATCGSSRRPMCTSSIGARLSLHLWWRRTI